LRRRSEFISRFEIARALVRRDHGASFIRQRESRHHPSGCKHGQHLVAPRNEIGNVVKRKLGKLLMLFRRFVVFVRISGGKFGKVVKEKLVMLFRRFVLFARNVGRNRGKRQHGQAPPQTCMATRNEFLCRNARATRFGNLDLAPSVCTLASPLLPNSPLKAA
jgi:hypothetical protein